MTFHVLLDGQAQRDFEEIEAYLDANAPDQTERFLDDLEATIAGIAEHPLLRPEVRPGVRHESLTVFRYHLWYRVTCIALAEVAEIDAAELESMERIGTQ